MHISVSVAKAGRQAGSAAIFFSLFPHLLDTLYTQFFSPLGVHCVSLTVSGWTTIIQHLYVIILFVIWQDQLKKYKW